MRGDGHFFGGQLARQCVVRIIAVMQKHRGAQRPAQSEIRFVRRARAHCSEHRGI